jgi:hypothetical protein
MNVGDEDVVSGFATLLPGAEGADEDAAAGEHHTRETSDIKSLLVT